MKDYFSEEDVLETMLLADEANGYGDQVPKRSKADYVTWMCKRTKVAAIEVVNLMERTKSSPAINVMRFQVIKSATSSAANYRAACRARSKNEFFAKMSIVVEETDETVYWLEMLEESNVTIDKQTVNKLHSEWFQLMKIMAKARSNIK